MARRVSGRRNVKSERDQTATDAHERAKDFLTPAEIEKLLEALSRMPPTSGVALGFDRLVMLALGAREIREVVAFADDEV